MIYRFDILSPSGQYEGWAHSIEEMRDKFNSKMGKIEPAYIFFAGGCPDCDYEEYEIILRMMDWTHSETYATARLQMINKIMDRVSDVVNELALHLVKKHTTAISTEIDDNASI